MIGEIAKELIGLFVDDEFLALAILVTVAVASALAFLAATAAWIAGPLLVVGLPAVLAFGVWRSVRRARRGRTSPSSPPPR